ncbi:hypothetical protein COT20_02635 [bacterium (Candidatus Gribaldobacteria) CG08_land_8_20_14_0_20_39_15]|uniref:DNA polymerase III subunit gamma/tau n=1 Tax=bacterium (Candidatus Gribaldobacteria) CG08_land_8_20_14_0_20_39_15 TaxID=2014273 RepID=A0A2M6XTY8_9BACT|nr:MAG: hypothetical protein COT20_02635 [bacterium (Candidatus Gribaldobacteria) CG08_land_8_20_14_0_20_39_15]
MVLYRKYRPKTFAEVVGQEHVVKTITNAIKDNMVSHGYLFAGPHGCGKTSLARLLAKALNCQQRKDGQFEPCNQCDSCLEINRGNAIDLIEIDAATYTGVDNIRELQDGIRFLPAKSKYKVFIIDECHQLSKGAASALLKTLEEPPRHVVFILATTESHKMIPTILSRCQCFYFRKLQMPEIIARLESILKQEKIAFSPEVLTLIAAQAAGALRDAESLLDEVVSFTGQDGKIDLQEVRVLLGLSDSRAVFQFLEFLADKKVKEAFEFINDLMFKAVDLREFAKSVIQFLREILLLKIDLAFQSSLVLSLTSEEKKQLLGIAAVFTEPQVKLMLEKFMEAENKTKYATILQLPLELAIVEICLENK